MIPRADGRRREGSRTRLENENPGKENDMTMRRVCTSVLIAVIVMAMCPPGEADAADVRFLFDNHIDNHQVTRLILSRSGAPALLAGTLLIVFTGQTDPASGLRIARHPGPGEVCGAGVDCVVGWLLAGRPAQAQFLYHTGVNGEDHPVWLLNRRDIPQPGSFTHFHWIGADSTDPRAGDVPTVCDQEGAGGLEAAGATGATCPGWLLQLIAVRAFAFQHGGEIIPVRPGVDDATHLNIVTNYRAVDGVVPTR
jgi:hypothetical protein